MVKNNGKGVERIFHPVNSLDRESKYRVIETFSDRQLVDRYNTLPVFYSIEFSTGTGNTVVHV